MQDKKWERRSEARPTELIEAALRLFAEQGFAATRLEDVASRAGVSKATIYRYFDNKEALFEAVVRHAVAPRFAQAELLLEAFEGSTADLLRTFFKVVKEALDGPFPPMAKLIITESGNFPELAKLWADLAMKRVLTLVASIVKRGVEHGEFRPVQPETIAPLVMAPVVLLGIWKQAFSPHTDWHLDMDELLDMHISLLVRGLEATPKASSEAAERREIRSDQRPQSE